MPPWASKLRDQWGTITGQGDRIKARAQELVSKGRARKNGPKVIAAVDTILASIAAVKEHQLLGANDPLLKARAAYGVAEHHRRQGGCTAKEVPISSSYCDNPHPKRRDCRIDCVKVSGRVCTIVEIKPRGAVELGNQQIRAYEAAVRKLFGEKGRDGFTDRLAVFRDCIADDGKSIAVKADVDPYDFCPAASEVGVVTTEVNVAIPEDEE